MSQTVCVETSTWTCAQCGDTQNPRQFYNCLRCMTPQNVKSVPEQELPVCCLCQHHVESVRATHNPAPLGPVNDEEAVCCATCNQNRVMSARLFQRHNQRVLDTVAFYLKEWVNNRACFASSRDHYSTKYAQFGDAQSSVESLEELEEVFGHDEQEIAKIGPCFLSVQHTQLPTYNNKNNQIVQGIHVQQLGVHPAWRRRGIGTALVRMLVTEAKRSARFRYVFVENVITESMRRLMERLVINGEFEPYPRASACYIVWL